jgi:hypothetical protein
VSKITRLARVEEILEELPTAEGGRIVVLSTAGSPPAVALLSSGDVLVADGRARAAVYGRSSAASRLGGAYTLLVADQQVAYRVEVVEASARSLGDLAVLEGEIGDVRPTVEPPWAMAMDFHPLRPEGVDDHLRYWQQVRGWLEAGTPEPAPDPPRS